MATLQIRKKSASVWLHIPSDNSQYIVSKLYCKTNGDYFRVIENGGRQRAEYHYLDITVHDDTQGGGAESFASSQALMLRLESLQYVGFEQGGGGQGVGFQPSIFNPQNGQVVQFENGVWHNAFLDLQGDRFLQIEDVEINGTTVTLPLGFMWIINGVAYSNLAPFVQNITLAETGKTRFDKFVALTNNSFLYIVGEEHETNPPIPQTPPNTLEVTTIPVFDDGVGSPTEPIIGSQYIKKTGWRSLGFGNGSAVNISLSVLTENSRNFAITSYGGASILSGFNVSTTNDTTYVAQIVTIANFSGEDIPMFQMDENTDLPLDFGIDEEGRHIKNKEVLTFRRISKGTANDRLLLIASNMLSFNPSDYDLSEFENESSNPFLRESIFVDTIEDLQSYADTSEVIIVKDELRGGVFVYSDDITLEEDNGTVFEATGKGSGYWVRQYNKEDGLNILWYGADPTGVDDTADIIEQVIIDWSYKTGKVYIPKGTYRIESPIGKLVSGQPLPIRPITNDVEVIGQGAIIDVQPLSGRISGAVSFSLDAVTVKFSGLVIQGNNNTNRGFYLRQQIPDFPTSEKSNVYIEGNRIYDILIQDGDIENSGIGVNIYGNMNSVIISDNIIENVTTDSETLVLKGIWIGGSVSNGMSVNTEVFSNTVKNVSRSDDESISDQDGIHLAGVTRTFGERFGRVYNNTIINTRGRFIKAQHHSIEIYGNLLVFTADYVPGEAKGTGIAVLESDANVYNNTMILNSTHTNVSNTSFVGFTERSQDTNPHRLNVYGNKLVSVQPLEYFATIWEEGSAIMKGVYNVYANTVNCVLDLGFVRHLTVGTYVAGERNINVFGNSISDLQGVGVSFEPNTNPVNVSFYNNNHSGATPVPVANDELNNLVSFNNQGFTDVGLNLALRANGYQADVSSESINLYGETEEDFVNLNFPKDEIGEGERTIATREWVNDDLNNYYTKTESDDLLDDKVEIGGDLGGTQELPRVVKISLIAEPGKTVVVTVLPNGDVQAEEIQELWVYDDTITGYTLLDLQTEYPTAGGYEQGFEVRCRNMTPPTVYRKDSENDSIWTKMELENVT